MTPIMTVYDKIGAEYDTLRSTVGAHDVLELVQELGDHLHVLDLGCGTGYPIATQVSALVHRYLGIDHSKAMLSAFRKNVPYAESQLLDIPQVERVGGEWDLIFSWGALCHLKAAAQSTALIAACRMLKLGGRLMFTSGQHPGHCKGSVGPHRVDHYSMGEPRYTDLLAAHGLSLLRAEARDRGNFTYLYGKMPNKRKAPKIVNPTV